MSERRLREHLRAVIDEIVDERDYQLKRWSTDHDAAHTPEDWVIILTSWLGKATSETPVMAASGYNREGFRKRLIQIAAICVAAVEAIDEGNGST